MIKIGLLSDIFRNELHCQTNLPFI